MQAYIDIVKKILEKGKLKEERTGVGTLAYPGMMFSHDMNEGFPLLTTKNVPFRLISSELEFFIKGITDKKWLQDKNNHIWDEWCTPLKVKYSHDENTKKRMLEERDLGPIYGWQWRRFNGKYKDYESEPISEGIDQLKKIIKTLKEDPGDRRMICSAWNPLQLQEMALPPCHYSFQIVVIDKKLSLLWNQRSVDVALGLPFNIASYGLLLHLLAKESGFKEGRLVGFLADTHIYTNHVEGMKEQIKRAPFSLPNIETNNFTDIFSWKHTDSKVLDYEHHPRIRFKIAV